jgi:hypothetical protein
MYLDQGRTLSEMRVSDQEVKTKCILTGLRPGVTGVGCLRKTPDQESTSTTLQLEESFTTRITSR